jgi:hypothetical protein
MRFNPHVSVFINIYPNPPAFLFMVQLDLITLAFTQIGIPSKKSWPGGPGFDFTP